VIFILVVAHPKERKNMNKSEQIRFKYGKSRWGLSYTDIAEEFDTCVSVVWKAINSYKGLGKGWNVKNYTKEEKSRVGRLGGIAAHKKGTARQWTHE
jgi:hypothetical protein